MSKDEKREFYDQQRRLNHWDSVMESEFGRPNGTYYRAINEVQDDIKAIQDDIKKIRELQLKQGAFINIATWALKALAVAGLALASNYIVNSNEDSSGDIRSNKDIMEDKRMVRGRGRDTTSVGF